MSPIRLDRTARYERLVDEAIRAYVDWREECIAVQDASSDWDRARATDATLAFAAYVAALDREERAAEVYATVIGRVGDLLPADGQPATQLAASDWAR